MRRRLDVELVRRRLASSHDAAAAAIAAGRVIVSGAVADNPARLVGPGEPVVIRDAPRFVSRGGEKLDAALRRFGIDVAGRHCLDAGASTGGFTDCLLQRGAAEVVAVEVGKGRLDWGLRSDPRVRVLEGVNARSLTLEQVGQPVDMVTADLSFISLGVVAPSLLSVAGEGADHVYLVKPQFEAGPDRVGPAGVVRDPAVHLDVLLGVGRTLAAVGLTVIDVTASPLLGPKGNAEFFLRLRADRAEPVPEERMRRAVAEAPRARGRGTAG